MSFFNIDGPLFSFLNKMADLVILNILFLICCLPIVTIGASTTALYYVSLRMVRNHEGYIARNFWKSFKENFRQATFIWIPALLMIIVLVLDIRIFNPSDSNTSLNPLLIGAYTLLILLIFGLSFVFPVLSRFSNTIKQTVKNTLLMAIGNLPFALCILLIWALPVVLTLVLPLRYGFVYILWLLFGFAFLAYISSFLFEYKIFKKYLPKDQP
ncbi:putative membrane protein YesL [Aequitasia blattaphilus]|uniref:YesL family protein n=1 Tax=Aequitasia blattaphilus TaxID=2949332 RepID=A0ABT1EBE4_9FIRM|nr:YesL family protein [Aequitasia blattaphilus]MCP1103001.1 YesL family protein [Aequitasia blattaphilus]MCR8615641.1 YesL family protein [Aequitasia blattaphilus]